MHSRLEALKLAGIFCRVISEKPAGMYLSPDLQGTGRRCTSKGRGIPNAFRHHIQQGTKQRGRPETRGNAGTDGQLETLPTHPKLCPTSTEGPNNISYSRHCRCACAFRIEHPELGNPGLGVHGRSTLAWVGAHRRGTWLCIGVMIARAVSRRRVRWHALAHPKLVLLNYFGPKWVSVS